MTAAVSNQTASGLGQFELQEFLDLHVRETTGPTVITGLWFEHEVELFLEAFGVHACSGGWSLAELNRASRVIGTLKEEKDLDEYLRKARRMIHRRSKLQDWFIDSFLLELDLAIDTMKSRELRRCVGDRLELVRTRRLFDERQPYLRAALATLVLYRIKPFRFVLSQRHIEGVGQSLTECGPR